MNDPRLAEFIVKATGKTIGRCSKIELSTLFANSYAEYVKSFNQLKDGYRLYKGIEGKLDKIKQLDGIQVQSSRDVKNIKNSQFKTLNKIIHSKDMTQIFHCAVKVLRMITIILANQNDHETAINTNNSDHIQICKKMRIIGKIAHMILSKK